MNFFTTILAIWKIVSPYLTADNWTAIVALFNKVVADFKGGDYAQLLADLIEGLKPFLPADAGPKMEAVAGIKMMGAAPCDAAAEFEKMKAMCV